MKKSKNSTKTPEKGNNEVALDIIEDHTPASEQRTSTSEEQSKKAKKSKKSKLDATQTQSAARKEPAPTKPPRHSSRKEKKAKEKSASALQQSNRNPSASRAPQAIQSSSPELEQSPREMLATSTTAHTQQARIKQEDDVQEISSDSDGIDVYDSGDEYRPTPTVAAEREHIIDKNGKRRKKSLLPTDIYQDIVKQRDEQIKALEEKLNKDAELYKQAFDRQKQKLEVQKQKVQLQKQAIEVYKHKVARRDQQLQYNDKESKRTDEILLAAGVKPMPLAEIHARMDRGTTAREAYRAAMEKEQRRS